MKKVKTLFILTLCFTFIVTTTTVTRNYDISPYGHYKNDETTF